MSKKKILIVDDEINVCKSIRLAVQPDVNDVDTALSGEEALQMSLKKKYDLIITDLMMPGISGMDLLEAVKIDQPDTAVIMVTGYPTIKTAVQAVKKGAFDYVPKPFTPQDLRAVVSRVFSISNDQQSAGLTFKVPSGYHYMIGHAWLQLRKDKLVYVGVVHDFFRSVAHISGVELPSALTELRQGEVCVSLRDDKGFTHRIWSPVTGSVARINSRVAGEAGLLFDDPYGEGWLFAVIPSSLEEDLEGLVHSR
ncbi:MAG: response regulator [Candidatus Aminicenantes bacterium]|nr:response regulator [Candidatus Aminicenantes bacterium]